MKTVKALLAEDMYKYNKYMGKDPKTQEPLEYKGHMKLSDLPFSKDTEVEYFLHNTRDPVVHDLEARPGRGSGLGNTFLKDVNSWTPEAIKYAHKTGRTLHVLPTDIHRDRGYYKILKRHGFKRNHEDLHELGRYHYDPAEHPENNELNRD